MSALTDFLLVRIAEDEAVATEAGGARWDEWALDSGDADHIARHDPARVLAECEAKRRIVISARIECGPSTSDEWLLPLLALPYADHPDYRQDWKP